MDIQSNRINTPPTKKQQNNTRNKTTPNNTKPRPQKTTKHQKRNIHILPRTNTKILHNNNRTARRSRIQIRQTTNNQKTNKYKHTQKILQRPRQQTSNIHIPFTNK